MTQPSNKKMRRSTAIFSLQSMLFMALKKGLFSDAERLIFRDIYLDANKDRAWRNSVTFAKQLSKRPGQDPAIKAVCRKIKALDADPDRTMTYGESRTLKAPLK